MAELAKQAKDLASQMPTCIAAEGLVMEEETGSEGLRTSDTREAGVGKLRRGPLLMHPLTLVFFSPSMWAHQ